ncbi:hypothetical protein L6R52_34005 [Myxococcota bacterium]|nr:hypothetical protein [Myxococcota bacterium]
MSISFQCTSCDADFVLEIPRIVDRPTAIKCPKCDARPPAHRAQALGTAIEDLLSAMAAIRSKVRFSLTLDTEALPPPYGPIAESEGVLTDGDDDLVGDDDEDEDEDAEEEDEDLDDEDEEDDDEESDDEEDEEEESDSEEEDDFDFDDDEDEEEEEDEE